MEVHRESPGDVRLSAGGVGGGVGAAIGKTHRYAMRLDDRFVEAVAASHDQDGAWVMPGGPQKAKRWDAEREGED